MIELIEMVENTQHCNHHKLRCLFLYFGIFHSKSVIIIGLRLDLAENIFHQFLPSVFKMNDTSNFEDKFLYIFSGYQTRTFH